MKQHTHTPAAITVMRFPHRTRDAGSVPPGGPGPGCVEVTVGWEPELTAPPHNNRLAVTFCPVSRSGSENSGGGKVRMGKDGKSPRWPWGRNPHGRKQGLGERRNTHGAATYLLGLGLADGVRDGLLLLLHGALGEKLDKLVKVHGGLHHFLPHERVDVSKEPEK